jgi:hypothetical protein
MTFQMNFYKKSFIGGFEPLMKEIVSYQPITHLHSIYTYRYKLCYLGEISIHVKLLRLSCRTMIS